VLKAKQLGEIENLQVSYEDPHLDGVQTTVYYTISTVKHVNSTAIQFLTDRGDTLSVGNGETFVQLAGSDVKYPVCKADVSCSALKVADFTASGELVTEAHEALDRAGFTWRRQLAETQCLYQGANFVSLHQRECSSLIDPMDLSGSPPIGGTAEQKQNCNRAEHCNVDYAARPNVCYDKCETLDTQAECEEGKGQRPEASWWNGYLRDANEGTRGCQWLDQPSEVTGKRCDVDCTERETLWDCIKHDKCQWVGQKSPLKFFCDNKCPIDKDECKAVQAERGSSVCTWDPSRGSWATYASGEHVYVDEGECIVPCNTRPDRLSYEFTGDMKCEWDDCKRECSEKPERVANLNLAAKEDYMKETSCHGRGVDSTWFYDFACSGKHSHCYVEDMRTPSFQRPFADQRRFLNYGDQCYESPCTDGTCSTFWSPTCVWNEKWSHPESDGCDWGEELDCGGPRCRADCLAINKLMLDPTYKDSEPKFPTNGAKAEHFCRLEGCSWDEEYKKCEWGLRQGCSIAWPRQISKHFTQAQLRGLNDGRDQDGGMGSWDEQSCIQSRAGGEDGVVLHGQCDHVQVITMKGRLPRSRCFEKCELRATERHCMSPGEGGRIGNMDERFVRTLEYFSPSGVRTPCDSFPAKINTATGEVVGENDPLGTLQMPMECISMCRWKADTNQCVTSCEMRKTEEACVKGGCDWDATTGINFGPGKVAQYGTGINFGMTCTGLGLPDGIPNSPLYDGLEGGRAVESVRTKLTTIQREKAQALGYGWPNRLGGSSFDGPVSDCVLESHLRGVYEQGKTEAELAITAPARAAACYASVQLQLDTRYEKEWTGKFTICGEREGAGRTECSPPPPPNTPLADRCTDSPLIEIAPLPYLVIEISADPNDGNDWGTGSMVERPPYGTGNYGFDYTFPRLDQNLNPSPSGKTKHEWKFQEIEMLFQSSLPTHVIPWIMHEANKHMQIIYPLREVDSTYSAHTYTFDESHFKLLSRQVQRTAPGKITAVFQWSLTLPVEKRSSGVFDYIKGNEAAQIRGFLQAGSYPFDGQRIAHTDHFVSGLNWAAVTGADSTFRSDPAFQAVFNSNAPLYKFDVALTMPFEKPELELYDPNVPLPPSPSPDPSMPPPPPEAPGVTGGASGRSTCTNTCDYSGDGDCDDGGPGSEFTSCVLGSDCADCGGDATNAPRPLPPPPSSPPSPPGQGISTPADTGRSTCTNTCNYHFDGDCDDGGPGSEYTSCDFGTDCADCGS